MTAFMKCYSTMTVLRSRSSIDHDRIEYEWDDFVSTLVTFDGGQHTEGDAFPVVQHEFDLGGITALFWRLLHSASRFKFLEGDI